MSLFVNVFFSWPHLYATYKGNEVANSLHTLCCHHTSCGLNKEQKQKKGVRNTQLLWKKESSFDWRER